MGSGEKLIASWGNVCFKKNKKLASLGLNNHKVESFWLTSTERDLKKVEVNKSGDRLTDNHKS